MEGCKFFEFLPAGAAEPQVFAVQPDTSSSAPRVSVEQLAEEYGLIAASVKLDGVGYTPNERGLISLPPGKGNSTADAFQVNGHLAERSQTRDLVPPKRIYVDFGEGQGVESVLVRGERHLHNFCKTMGIGAVKPATDLDADLVDTFDGLVAGMTYFPVSFWSGQLKTMCGAHANFEVGLEQKLDKRLLRHLQAGHPAEDVRLLRQHNFKSPRTGDKREVDALGSAPQCLYPGEAKAMARASDVVHLQSTLEFLREHQHEKGFEAVKGKELRGVLYTHTVDRRELVAMQKLCETGFEGHPILLWTENGRDISPLCAPSPRPSASRASGVTSSIWVPAERPPTAQGFASARMQGRAVPRVPAPRRPLCVGSPSGRMLVGL